MDEVTLLKHRVMSLEATIRKMDRLLIIVCKNLIKYDDTSSEARKAAEDYLKVFQDQPYSKI